jgi:hypothetical protein
MVGGWCSFLNLTVVCGGSSLFFFFYLLSTDFEMEKKEERRRRKRCCADHLVFLECLVGWRRRSETGGR